MRRAREQGFRFDRTALYGTVKLFDTKARTGAKEGRERMRTQVHSAGRARAALQMRCPLQIPSHIQGIMCGQEHGAMLI